MAEGGPRFTVRIAAVLREALARLAEAEGRESYVAFEYLRSAMSKIARVDAFYVGLLQGTGRVIFP
ncbi:hypothetical protein [Kribbella sp. NPDC006257]|uniref:hypothetical protein n=1 Tax=Kribbella sp. NPDC006257 TaxID=3156738 RepID=UPI0033B13673